MPENANVEIRSLINELDAGFTLDSPRLDVLPQFPVLDHLS